VNAVTKCLICGTAMVGLHCKQTCPMCGYREDCSDAGLILYPDEDTTDDAERMTLPASSEAKDTGLTEG
jgi:hypothetical protein